MRPTSLPGHRRGRRPFPRETRPNSASMQVRPLPNDQRSPGAKSSPDPLGSLRGLQLSAGQSSSLPRPSTPSRPRAPARQGETPCGSGQVCPWGGWTIHTCRPSRSVAGRPKDGIGPGPWSIPVVLRTNSRGRTEEDSGNPPQLRVGSRRHARLPTLNGHPIHPLPAHKCVILCEAIEIGRVGHKLDMGYLVASNPMMTRPGAGTSAHAWEAPTRHR